jgi:hypothetical protein
MGALNSVFATMQHRLITVQYLLAIDELCRLQDLVPPDKAAED